jgi:GNAT superfamily N-acetyltransferase
MKSKKPRINLKYSTTHYAIKGKPSPESVFIAEPDPRLPDLAKKFWRKYLGSCDGGVVATHKGRVIGFCRYYYYSKKKVRVGFAGTWIHPKYRKLGLASKMWNQVLPRLHKTKKIEAAYVSKGGEKLLKSLASKYPKFKWNIE